MKPNAGNPPKLSLSKSKLLSLLLFSLSFNIYSIHKNSSSCSRQSKSVLPLHSQPDLGAEPELELAPEKTGLNHVVFGLGVAARYWVHRKNYIKLWWRPGLTRGYIWMDLPVNITEPDDPNWYPEIKISSDTSRFPYKHHRAYRRILRLTRIVSEIVRLKLEGVRWIVVGDDDTVFYPDNLVRVLKKYDHTEMYYIGSHSENHIASIHFSYGMAFGGGGYAISYPLAKEIEKMQDRCIQRYDYLYGSDDRIFACVSDLGVPLTKEPGFHQLDVYGNTFGLLAAHPVAPLVSLHHFDKLQPILPTGNRLRALEVLTQPAKVDSAALLQQSICYDSKRNWTISVSWGYAVQIVRGVIPVYQMARPARTFMTFGWTNEADKFTFDSRPGTNKEPCQEPYVYFISKVEVMNDTRTNMSRSEYGLFRIQRPSCGWKMESPQIIQRVEVYKIPNPNKWDKAPRRDCCRVLPTEKEGTMAIDVGQCKEGEVVEPQPL